jgi:dihydroorotase-like cyclic amidohydrolase
MAARGRGLEVSCEVTPHHLFLTEEDELLLGNLATVNPPLRSRGDVEWLWQHLDEVDMIASDHAPHTLAEKEGPEPPPGLPGLETMLPLLLTAVLEGRLSWEELARLTAAGPARVYGLEGKGRIAPGCDADLVLVSSEGEGTLGEGLHTKCGWTPFAGRRVRGGIERAFLRGREVLRQEEILVEPGFGRPVEFG